jgi:hypothetical protein
MKLVEHALPGKPQGKRLLRSPICRWKGNIKVVLSEIGCESVDWIELVQRRAHWWPFVDTMIYLQVP